MRVIAGTRRSLPLKTLPGPSVRPTTDKIKETLFNMLQFDVPGSRFLDLFSGSGAIGIEALSRGAVSATFLESDRQAFRVLSENVAFTKFTEEAELLCRDVLLYLNAEKDNEKGFDLVFMDPPYDHELEKEALTVLSVSKWVRSDTLIIVEASLQTDFSYLPELGFTVRKEKKYKTNQHLFIQKEKEEK